MSETTWECWKMLEALKRLLDPFFWIGDALCIDFRPMLGRHLLGKAGLRRRTGSKTNPSQWIAKRYFSGVFPSAFSGKNRITEAAQHLAHIVINKRFTQLDVELPSEKGIQADGCFLFAVFSLISVAPPGISRLGPGMTTWWLGKVARNRAGGK